MAEGTDCACCRKGVLLEGKRGTFGGQKEYIWKTTVFTSENDGNFLGVGRNNCSGYGEDAIASYNDAIVSYVIANLLRNTLSRATTTHAICCAT